MRKFLSFLGGIAAFVTVAAYAVHYLNLNFNFINNETVLLLLGYIKEFGALIVLAITGLEFVWVKKGGLLFVVIYLAIVAVVVIFMFFPNVAASFVGSIAK